jgi:hypothetical protein
MPLTPAKIREGLRDGWIVPLLQPHDLYLFAPDRDGQRFAELFRATWQELPGHATNRVLRYWRSRHYVAEVLPMRPTIEFLGFWARRYGDLWSYSCHAHRLLFHSSSVAQMPDSIVQTLVACALARVFDIAVVGYQERNFLEEGDVISRLVNSWGFDDDDLACWCWVHPPEQEG